jgi:hypothetical protein
MVIVRGADKRTSRGRDGLAIASILFPALLFSNLLALFMSLTVLPTLGSFVTVVLLAVLGSLIFSAWILMGILRSDDGTPDMHVVSDAIREGAEGYFPVFFFFFLFFL